MPDLTQMSFETYCFLKLLRYKPRTVGFLRSRLNMSIEDFQAFLEGIPECYQYDELVPNPDDLYIQITSTGKIMCDERRRQNMHWYVPLIVSIIALIISIAAFICSLIL